MNRLFGSLQSLLDSLPLPPLFSNAIDLATRQVHELKSYSNRLSVNYERLVEAATIYLVPTLHFLRRRLSATTRKQRKARRAHRSKSLRHTAVQRLITVLLGVINRILSTVDRPTRKKSQVLLASPTKLSARQRFPFAFREIRYWRYERVMSMIMHVGIWMMDTFFWMCNRWSKNRPTEELYLSSQARLVAPKSFGEPPLGIPPYSDELSRQKEKLRLRRRWSWPAPAFPNTALNDADFILPTSTDAVWDALQDRGMPLPLPSYVDTLDPHGSATRDWSSPAPPPPEDPPTGPPSPLASLGTGIPQLIWKFLLEPDSVTPIRPPTPPRNSRRLRRGRSALLDEDSPPPLLPYPAIQSPHLRSFALVCRDWYSIYLRSVYKNVALNLTPSNLQIADKLLKNEDFCRWITHFCIEAGSSVAGGCNCATCIDNRGDFVGSRWGTGFEKRKKTTSDTTRGRRSSKVATPLLLILPVLPNLRKLELYLKSGGGRRALDRLSKSLHTVTGLQELRCEVRYAVTHPGRKTKVGGARIGGHPSSGRFQKLSPRSQDDVVDTFERLILAAGRQQDLRILTLRFGVGSDYGWSHTAASPIRIPTSLFPRYHLRELSLSNLTLTDMDLWWLLGASQDSLRKFSLQDCMELTPTGLEEALEQFGQNITHLDIYYIDLTNNGGAFFNNIVAPLPSLVSLRLGGNSLTDQVLQQIHLSSLLTLELLDLQGIHGVLPSILLQTLRRCPKLSEVSSSSWAGLAIPTLQLVALPGEEAAKREIPRFCNDNGIIFNGALPRVDVLGDEDLGAIGSMWTDAVAME